MKQMRLLLTTDLSTLKLSFKLSQRNEKTIPEIYEQIRSEVKVIRPDNV